MSRQNTLFKTWRVDKSSEVLHNADPSTSSRPSTSYETESEGFLQHEDEDFNLDDFEDFLDDGDDTTEAELIQARDSTLPSATDNLARPLKQNTISFHVGPSAATHSIMNCSITEENIPGFDVEAGEIWIYPTNYPIRDYQFNIVKKVLFVNSLVCLPTGLGKTFIGAVVMYNFYRWYPSGKIVFLAPTKPLVSQQIEACYGVMGIPQEHAAEMTGNMPPKDRAVMWQQRRVFFLTPQVLQNDLSKGTCPAKDIKCVVFDEAHKALGNHAYCQVIKMLTTAGGQYRVLALSATPGNDIKAVQQVVTSLQIGHIELRSDDSFDIQQYVHERKVEKIVVPLEGEILDIKNRFLKVLTGVIGKLTRSGVMYHSSLERLSKYQLLQARDQFRTAGPPAGVMAGTVEGNFALAISLFHAFELLQLHGLRSFHQFLKTTFSAGAAQSFAKMEIIRSPIFNGIMKELHEKLLESKSSPESLLGQQRHFPITGNDGFDIENETDCSFFYSHPKLKKLEEVVVEHFRSFRDERSSSSDESMSTRVMIFSQYRESVQEIADMLSHHLPLVKVMTFVGHSTGKSNSKGLTQKEQTEIVRKFREGGYNTLVATCVGEEGLDIGEVDLIVCFDASKSPIRLVQRMGRTGRKRRGRIVVIVAEGKEDQIYNKSESNKKRIHRVIKEGCKTLNFFQQCPRMVPRHIKPQVHKMQMTIDEFVNEKGKKRVCKRIGGVRNLQTKFGVDPMRGNKKFKGAFLNDQELARWSNELSLSDREFRAVEKSVQRCFSRDSFLSLEQLKSNSRKSPPKNSQHSLENSCATTSNDSSLNSSTLVSRFSLNLGKWTHLQTSAISTKVIGHSSKSAILMSSLEFIDTLQSSEGMGAAYDLEMETFLDPADIKSADDKKQAKDLRRNRKQKRVFLDSSDEEDFITTTTTKTTTKTTTTNSAVTTAKESLPSPKRKKLDQNKRKDGASSVQFSDELINEGAITDFPTSEKDCIHFTASQHVVPRAPVGESLDWLDGIDPSQSQRTKSTILPTYEKTNNDPIISGHNEFNFITPKAPPCKRRSKILLTGSNTTTYSSDSIPETPLKPVSTSKSISKTITDCPENVDLFDDLSAQDLFGEFSTSNALEETKEQGDESSSPAMEFVTSNAHKETKMQRDKPSPAMDFITSNKLKEPEVIMELPSKFGNSDPIRDPGGTDDLDDDVIFITNSDSEEDCGKDKVIEHQNVTLTSTPKAETDRKKHSDLALSEDRYVLNPGKKRRKRVNILESPQEPVVVSPEQKVTYSSRKVITGSNERGSPLARKRLHETCTLIGNDEGSSPLPRRRLHETTAKKATFNLNTSDDDFLVPLMKRVHNKSGKNPRPQDSATFASKMEENHARSVQDCKDYIEEEAELSGEDSWVECDPESQNDYDMSDSFINDNSVLTQYVSTQMPSEVTRSTKKSSASGIDMYRQSLVSPNDKIFSKRKCNANRGKFRMVLSQRHKLLNHYMEKAEFQASSSSGTKRSRSLKGKGQTDHWSSGSEAEEVGVAFGEEDMEELSHSFNHEIEELLHSEDQKEPVVGGNKQRAAFLSSSEAEEEMCEVMSSVVDEAKSSVSDKVTSEETNLPQKSNPIHQEEEVRTVDLSRFKDVIVSPSLLKSVKIFRTPSCFSLGMDDWLTDIEYDEGKHQQQENQADTNKEFEDFDDTYFDDDIILSQDYH